MTISHVHCQVRDLSAAVDWFAGVCALTPSFRDAVLAVFSFDDFTFILDAASIDGAVTIGFNSSDCRRDFDLLISRGARVLEPPQDRAYGARVAYLQGPGAIKIELEQMLSSETR